MTMKSELCVGGIILKDKPHLVPTNLNVFGMLIFPMNDITGPGTYNTSIAETFNTNPLTSTQAMPNYMGSGAQSNRYQNCLPTHSSIAITINMTIPNFYRTGETAESAVYDSAYDEVFYFCLVPYNSRQTLAPELLGPTYMPWAQVIRQPGARRMQLRCKDGRVSGTLRASTNIGRLEGTPSWETDPFYRSQSEDSVWGTPPHSPQWWMYAYYPSAGWDGSQAMFEITVKLGMKATFFMPKIATLYTSLDPTETKVSIMEGDDEKQEPDDDDPSLLDMKTFVVTEDVKMEPPPPLTRTVTQGRIMPTGAAGPRRPVPRPPKPGGAPRSGGGEARRRRRQHLCHPNFKSFV